MFAGMRATLLLHLLAVSPAPTAGDTAYMRTYFEENFAVGDRAILTNRGVGEDDGADKLRAICMSKGPQNSVAEPVMFADIHSSLIRVSSRAACAFGGAESFFGSVLWQPDRRLSESSSGESPEPDGNCSLPMPS